MYDPDLMPNENYLHYLLSRSGKNLYTSYRQGGIEAFAEALRNFPEHPFDTTSSLSYGMLNGRTIRNAILARSRYKYTPFKFTEEDMIYMAALDL